MNIDILELRGSFNNIDHSPVHAPEPPKWKERWEGLEGVGELSGGPTFLVTAGVTKKEQFFLDQNHFQVWCGLGSFLQSNLIQSLGSIITAVSTTQ